MPIRICAVQSKINQNFDKNMSRVEQFFKTSNKNNCGIICFPEVFLTGPLNKNLYNPRIPIKSKKMFSELSKNYGVYSVMGSIIEKVNNDFYNTSYLFDNKGHILGCYKKIHLVKSESKYLKSGNNIVVFKTKIGNIGVQICRDLLYPEITRELMLKKAQIVFCPSFWSSKSSSYEWMYNNKYFKNQTPREVDSLVSARSIENGVIFVYVNAAGRFNAYGIKDTLLGRTQMALPFYGTINTLNNNKEGIIIKEIDLGIIKDAQKVYKIEKDLKNYYK